MESIKGKRIVVITDIHGHAAEFEELLILPLLPLQPDKDKTKKAMSKKYAVFEKFFINFGK